MASAGSCSYDSAAGEWVLDWLDESVRGTVADVADLHPTERLRLDEIRPTFKSVLASLHVMSPTRGPLALRRGIVEALIEVATAMRSRSASAGLVVEARDLVEALSHMPWEGSPRLEPVSGEIDLDLDR